MDARRNRASLGELRQVAEDVIADSPRQINVRTTDCLGVCKPGHVMGFLDPDRGVYIYNGMDSKTTVKTFCEAFLEGLKTNRDELPAEFRDKLEFSLPPEAVDDIPWG